MQFCSGVSLTNHKFNEPLNVQPEELLGNLAPIHPQNNNGAEFQVENKSDDRLRDAHFDSMNNSIITPIMPYLLKELQSTTFQQGFMYSAYSVMQFISSCVVFGFTARCYADGSI